MSLWALENHAIFEFAKHMDQFNQNRFTGLYFSFSVVCPCDHAGSITLSKRNCAASSPRPL